MRWLLMWVPLYTAVAAIELHCAHPLCKEEISYGQREFTVEGHKIEFSYNAIKNEEISEKFNLDCGGWQALDSPAMPRFAAEYRSSRVELSNCPLPTRNTPIAAALAALNVKLQPVEDKLFLELTQFPAELLTANHFIGFEHLTYLQIYSEYDVDPYQRPTPEAGFLAGLRNLRSLHLIGVRLPAGEIYRLPQSLTRLWLCGESLNSLPGTLPAIMSETVRALPGLKHLMLDQWKFTKPEFIDSAKTDTKLQLNATYSLESLTLMSWKEPRLVPLEQCDFLRSLTIDRLKSAELPDRWLAACPHLEKVMLEVAEQLTSLPAKLLEGATALKRLSIRITKIRSLPDGFLEGAPNLRELDLSNNRLRGILPSGVFLGPALQSLSLESNKIRIDSLPAIAPLTSLTKLKLGSNQFRNICEDNGYSSLRNLTLLKTLSLGENPITQICHDWRENLTHLEKLNLVGTGVSGLSFTDYLFTRDATVKNAVVTLSTSIYHVNFTNSNYESALAAPGPGVTFKFESNWRYPNNKINCDCSAYWLRRAVDSASHLIRLEGLTCKNGRDFKQLTPEEMCPEKAQNTA